MVPPLRNRYFTAISAANGLDQPTALETLCYCCAFRHDVYTVVALCWNAATPSALQWQHRPSIQCVPITVVHFTK